MTTVCEKPMMMDVYRLLARSMHYPEPDWLNTEYLSVLSAMLQDLSWQQELSELQTACENDTDLVETLQIEHTRLFINAVPGVVAPPYGSVYLSSDGTLLNSFTERTKAFYRDKGFELSSSNDIPDYIVHELEFLGLLSGQKLAADEEIFLEKHFRPWFHLFRDRVINGANHPFYRIVVKLIDFFTKEEM